MNYRILIPEVIVVQKIENESVVINLLTEKHFHLDEIGAYVWDSMVRTMSLEGAIEDLLSDFDVDRNRLEQDVIGLFKKLEDFGLISLISTSESQTE